MHDAYTSIWSRFVKINLALFTHSIIFLTSLNSSAFTSLERAIAIVDEEVILASELSSMLQVMQNRMNDKADDIPLAALRKRVIDHLILESLQLQMARRAGMTVNETEINQAVEKLRRNLKKQQQSMDVYLQQNHFTDLNELREEIRRELLIRQLQKYQINRRIRISEQEVENFLNSSDGEEWKSPQYRLQHILIATDIGDRGSANTADKRAKAIYQHLLDGANFTQMATDMSDGENAKRGGDLGWRKSSNLPNLFVERIKGKQIGSITEPFRSGAGIHILKLVDRKGVDQAMVKQSTVRHILIKTSAITSDDDARQKLNNLRNRVLSGEDFNALATQYSEDIATALNGGDLGWSTPGKFVPIFEETMNKTSVGEVSLPFRTQFGWHVLYVEDRREQDMTDTLVRNQASRLLRQLRFEDELQIWLQEIRDNAYVEVLI